MTLDFPTSFDLPTREEALYRAWRLRRLIAVATAIPFVIFALLGLVGLNGVAGSTFGLIFLTIIFVAMIGAHAIIFPNAHEETLTISLLLAAFGLIMAIIPGFFLAFALWIALAIWALMWGQAKLTDLQMATEPHQPVMKGRIKVRAKPEAVRAWYPLRPESERGLHKCGAPDQDGVFPVWYDSRMPDIFETDHRSETPAQPEAADQAAPRRASGVSEHDAEDPVHAISRVLRDEVVQHDAPRFDMSHPSFWARIEADEPDYQKTSILSRDGNGALDVESVVEHRFETKRNAVVVSETNTPASYPRGMTFTMWLNDFHLDGLIYLRELLEGDTPRALRSAHRWSLLMLAGHWFMSRQVDELDTA